MGEYLQHYKVKLHALAPIYIGSGRLLNKKEYIFLPSEQKVIVPNLEKMHMALRRKYKEEEYVQFMLNPMEKDLGSWLKRQGFAPKDYMEWAKYVVDAGDSFAALADRGKTSTKGVNEFMRDAYGYPYVPGSSIKGMLRTALLAYEMHREQKKFSKSAERLQDSVVNGRTGKAYLRDEMKEMESVAFHTLNRPQSKWADAVNCNLSGLIISDSEPIRMDAVVLCQKIDYSLEKKEKPINILRECLKPGTEVCFEITIDKSQCPYDKKDIVAALDYFQKVCAENFYARFGRGAGEPGTVWLGGGVGYLSKTILYPMIGRDAYRTVDKIFEKSQGDKIYRMHKHRDAARAYKIAPHVCKCTRYKGKLYDMGKGRLEFLE